MAKSGPEDVFAAVPDDKKIEGAPTTGGRRWNMGVPTEIDKMLSGFDFPSIEDFDRLMLNALRTNKERSATGDLYKQLDGDRNLCTKPRFNLQFCLRERLAHQQSDCAPARAEVIKCRVKV